LGGQDGARAKFEADFVLCMLALIEAAELGDVLDFVRGYGARAVRRTFGSYRLQ